MHEQSRNGGNPQEVNKELTFHRHAYPVFKKNCVSIGKWDVVTFQSWRGLKEKKKEWKAAVPTLFPNAFLNDSTVQLSSFKLFKSISH